MNGLLYQLRISLRLHFRNRLALLYSYLIPTFFLIAFWALYRHELVPLVAHMGELLTVTALGGACFGLPTTMVSERERGVWRRYRLAPVPTWSLVVSTVAGRYVLLILAALLQLALAMAIGMPLPQHPIALCVAFTFVAFAFLGLGLVIATLADNVPAVQALGQCIFLPMLIIGGVAVRLESLPAWAQHLSAFLPGRYAVEALQASVTGDGLSDARFSLLALLVIGGAGCLAGAKMFRWEAQQRFAAREGRGWLAVALAAWVAVGVSAEAGGEREIVRRAAPWDRPASRDVVAARPEPAASVMEPLSSARATNVTPLPMPTPPAAPSKSTTPAKPAPSIA
ncbi:MAG: ABC transporter permease, partial [Vicinamibacteraceae bacterium]